MARPDSTTSGLLLGEQMSYTRQHQMRAIIIKHYEQRREERENWHAQGFWEKASSISRPSGLVMRHCTCINCKLSNAQEAVRYSVKL